MADKFILPKSNPICFYSGNNGGYYDKLKNFENTEVIPHIYQKSDKIVIQIWCDDTTNPDTFDISLQILDINKNNLGINIPLTLKTTSIVTDLNVYESDYSLSSINEGVYFLQLAYAYSEFEDYIFFSEAICVKTTHENSILINYFNDENDFDCAFDTNINFQFRVTGGFLKDGFSPASKDVVYKNQRYDNVQLSSLPYNVEKLTIGASEGIPNFIADIINRALSCSNFYVDGVRYVKNEGTKFERNGIDKYYPLAAWSIELIKSINEYSIKI